MKKQKLKKYNIGTSAAGIAGQANAMGLDFLIGNAASVVNGIFDGFQSAPDPMNAMFHNQEFANGGTVVEQPKPKPKPKLEIGADGKPIYPIAKVKGDGSWLGNKGAEILNWLNDPAKERAARKFQSTGGKVIKTALQLVDETGVSNYPDAYASMVSDDPWGLKAMNLAGALPAVGGPVKFMGKAIKATELFPKAMGTTADMIGLMQDGKKKMAMGGKVKGGVPVEVEGDEVAETPFGGIINFDGPSHEQGGIDTALPAGTTVFSDRISVDGKTMADRKKSRVRREKTLSSFLDTNPTDMVSKNTLDRTKKFLDQEDENDLGIQQLVAITEANDEEKLALGTGLLGLGGIGDPLRTLLGGADNLIQPAPEASDNILGPLPGIPYTPAQPVLKIAGLATPPIVAPNTDVDASMSTPGDQVGQFGNAFGSITPLLTTLANRAGDTRNINAFENFGNDALTANGEAMQQASAIKSQAEQKVQLQAQGQRNRNRNSAGSVNTLRALDFVTSAGVDNADSDIYSNFAREIEGLYSQKAQLENQQDAYVMQGEQQRDQADRVDRDAFFNNLGENLTGVAKGITQAGKDMNASLSNQDMLDIMADMSANGITYFRDKNGRLKQKKVK